MPRSPQDPVWPELALDDWEPTYKTLHRWTQVIGKVRLACTPQENHWWNVPLYVTGSGLTTAAMTHGNRQFEVRLEFAAHQLRVQVSDGAVVHWPLEAMPVSAFYAKLMHTLDTLGLSVKIWPMPVEIENPVRFTDDHDNAFYDPRAVERFWAILTQVDRVFKVFRAAYFGKSSPVHFFWGAFDHAMTRFNGEVNPSPPTDPIMREAYSHAVISHGFWPGGDWPNGGRVASPVFYAYALPEPQGFREADVEPDAARYDVKLGEFLLPYDAVREADDPDAVLLSFLQSTYAAGADAGGWDRASLER